MAPLFVPLSAAPSQLMVVPLTLLVMLSHLVPPSTEPYRMSPAVNAALSVAVMVCAAVFVVLSVVLLPVSALNDTEETVTVGAVVSST